MSTVGDEPAGHVPEICLDFLPIQATPVPILYGGNGQRITFLPRARLGGRFLLTKEHLEGGNDRIFLTCYRRNLFSIAGLLLIDEWPTWALPPGMVRDPNGQDPKITGLFAQLKAVESWDSTEVAITSGANRSNATTERGARPADIPLLPTSRNGDASGTSPEPLEIRFSWERLQFRSATANNGKRRKEIRQQFKVIIKILGSKEDGTCILIAELASSFLTVRGRSPKSFATAEASQMSELDLYPPEHDVTGPDMQLPTPTTSNWASAPEASFFNPYSSYVLSDPDQELVYSQTMWDWMNPSEFLLKTSTSILDTEQSIEKEANVARTDYDSQHGVTDNQTCRQLSEGHLMSMVAPCRPDVIAGLDPDEVSWAAGLREISESPPGGLGRFPADTVSISAFAPEHSDLTEHTSSPRAATASTVSVEGQTSDASKKQRMEPLGTPRASGNTQSRYKYIPIGISGWQPPIEPVYWPHPWSHIERVSEICMDSHRIKPYYTHLEHKRFRV